MTRKKQDHNGYNKYMHWIYDNVLNDDYHHTANEPIPASRAALDADKSGTTWLFDIPTWKYPKRSRTGSALNSFRENVLKEAVLMRAWGHW